MTKPRRFQEEFKGWIGVDLDKTLAYYDEWRGAGHIGEPIPLMLERVKGWLSTGIEVRIFTARISHDGTRKRIEESVTARMAIEKWCQKHLGQVLKVTNTKDYDMVQLWDDRAIGVVPNEGTPLINP